MADKIAEITVTDRLKEERNSLIIELHEALDHGTKVSIQDVNSGNLPPIDITKAVLLSEQKSHLYPWLLTEGYKLTGLNEDEATTAAIESAHHEYDHNNIHQGNQTGYLGARFLDIVNNAGRHCAYRLQPFDLKEGGATQEEMEDILTNPRIHSTSDKKDLEKIHVKI